MVEAVGKLARLDVIERPCGLPAQRGPSLTPVPGPNGPDAGAGGMTLAGTCGPLVA